MAVANALQTAHAYNMTMTGYGPVDNEVSEETIEASSVDYMCVPSLPCRLVSKVASRNRKGLISVSGGGWRFPGQEDIGCDARVRARIRVLVSPPALPFMLKNSTLRDKIS